VNRPLRILRLFLFAGLLHLCPVYLSAEQLPIHSYTTAEGLARDFVSCIVQDSRGFLWFCTGEGLSRFDGYSFASFGREAGMPGRSVTDLIEARDGTIWVATDDGLTRLDPTTRFHSAGPKAAPPLFRTFRPQSGENSNVLKTLVETRDGTLLVGSFGGLFRFDPKTEKFQTVDLGDASESGGQLQINDLLEDGGGNLWIATRYLGLLCLHPDGRLDRYLTPVVPPAGNIRALAFDGVGGMWVGGYDGLRHLVADPGGSGRLIPRELYSTSDGLPERQIYSLLRASGGRLIVGTGFGIALSSPESGAGPQFIAVGPPQGLSMIKAITVSEDRSGNLWVGSDGSGAIKIAQAGFTSFSAKDGLPGPYCVSFLPDSKGHLYASTHTRQAETVLSRLEESPFPAIRINVPPRIRSRGWGGAQLTLQDHLGDWWVPTGEGLVRFSGIRKTEELVTAIPSAIYTVEDGLPSNEIYRLFEDSRGDLWVIAYGLARYDRATGRFQKLSGIGPSALGEDAAGNVWIGGWDGDLTRYRDGRKERFIESDGVPRGTIAVIFRDSHSRLWIGSSDGGVARLDDPTTPKLSFTHYTPSQGLSSSQVNCIVEDQWGRIYLGTGRGVDMLDPDSGLIHHFTTADGLSGSDVLIAARDAAGSLWFGTQAGLSRLVPRAPGPRKPPPIWISTLSISGVRQPINLLGEQSLEGLRLGPSQRDVEIGFVGLDFGVGAKLRYQYRLEGAEVDWSVPSDRRSVNYANLSPGRYRFAVKALDSDGQGSVAPATLSFTILPPVWQRGWFLILNSLLAIGGFYALHRYRVVQLLKLERVRTRIAADLHDDIGASLSRIAMQSELLRLPEVIRPPDARRLLSDIGESARSLVDSMSDIVWSVDPKRDDLASLAARVRQFALGMFEPRGIVLDLKVPESARRVILAPEDRRHLYLLIKEAVNNIARHSGCRNVSIQLAAEGNRLMVEIRDDGRGFAAPAGTTPAPSSAGGHGLRSMSARAEQLRGSLSVASTPGEGTILRLTCMLQQSGA
jgi:ligand-binding sensor domain-containing protein/signal transduction histidine kinase